MNIAEILYLVLNELEICASQLPPDEDRRILDAETAAMTRGKARRAPRGHD